MKLLFHNVKTNFSHPLRLFGVRVI